MMEVLCGGFSGKPKIGVLIRKVLKEGSIFPFVLCFDFWVFFLFLLYKPKSMITVLSFDVFF